jgi:CheY-like chemotaxis protein
VASKKRILYVEYDPLTAGKRHALMVAAGYTVGVVMSSHQAIQLVGTDFFDLLVLSESIPQMELERISRVSHNRAPKLPLLLLTAQTGMQSEPAALDFNSQHPLIQQIEQMLKTRDAAASY